MDKGGLEVQSAMAMGVIAFVDDLRKGIWQLKKSAPGLLFGDCVMLSRRAAMVQKNSMLHCNGARRGDPPPAKFW
jgi:hypothetical protein